VILGISDVKGGIWKPDGIDIRQLEGHVAEAGSVVGFPGSEPLSNSDLITQPCDVLIPAAVGGQIHEGNADRVKAAIVAEGANGPTTPEADVDPARARRDGDPRHPLQRRRRGRLLLRMGAGVAVLLLARERDHRPAGRK